MRRLAVVATVGCVLAGTAAGIIGTRRALAALQPSTGYSVSLTPDGDNEPIRDAGGTYTTTFTITNTGTLTASWEVTCGSTGGVTCTWGGATYSNMTPGESRTVKYVGYSVAGSNGTITVVADGPGGPETGYKNVIVRPAITIATPGTTTYSRMPLLQARFFPNDANLDTATLVVVVGSDTVTNLTRRNRGMVEWELDSLRQLSPGTAKAMSVRICLTNGQCNTQTRNVTLDNSGKPWVSFGGMPLEAHGRTFGAPFGPGLAVSAAEVETGVSVPAYVSMGAARSVGLVYSTRQSHPRAIVNTDIELSWPAGNPDQLKAVLIDGTARLDSVVLSSPTCQAAVGRRCRVALQADFAGSSFATATRKWLRVEVTVTSGGTPKTTTDSVEVVLVDRRSSSYGSGWAVGGVLRLDSAGTDMILVGSSGSATIFRGRNGVYLSPPGDYSLLIWTGSVWELRFRTGGKLVFDSQGRQTKIVDRDGNETVIAYSGTTDRVTTITDPVSKQFSFSYDGSNKIQTITDPGSRQNRFSVNGSNQLTYDSTSSPTATPYTETFNYTSSGTNSAILLVQRKNAVGDSTTVVYNSRNRPIQSILARVRDENGSWTNPDIDYVAQEIQALGTLISADSSYVSVTDPRGNWTRSALNRWGAAIRTWDALGTIARASFTGDGFVAWSEGKVADSTRVYNTYDVSGHLVRVHRWRAAGDMVRLDSLVYDANHWVIRRVDALGRVSKVDYDSEGHVIRAITPDSDTTRFWYRTDGLLDSSRTPTQTASTRFGYNPTWLNNSVTWDGQGRKLFERTLDALGRADTSQNRVTTRQSGSTTYYRWHRSVVAFNAAGQATSSRVESSNECSSCTGGSPGWPSLNNTDSARFDSVGIVYSRLGRDSLRLNIRGQGLRVVYDALGRVRARYPWINSSSEVDSFRYDVAGNLRYHWTRRGHLIEHYYDSRNRDTATVVPGIGTYKPTFGGPNDELTRLWISGFTDSIADVNPNVSWVYSQAGLLLSDTSQGNRVVTRTYDRYGRDTALVDVNGTWRLRYDPNSRLDSVFTPFADSLVYSFDAAGRAHGPTVRAGAGYSSFLASQTFTAAGQLEGLSSVHGYTVGEVTDIDTTDIHTVMRVGWQEKHGSSDPVRTLEDSLRHDGFERILAAVYRTAGATVATDSFLYDRDGGIRPSGESRTYDTLTMRLAARAGNSHTYDAAGNLTSDGVLTFGYNALNRLVSVRYGNWVVARYAYDVLGRRIVRRVLHHGPFYATTGYFRMIYRGGQVTAEADSGGTLTLGYTWGLGPDDLVGIRDYGSGQHYYVVQDGLRTVRALSRRDGTWTAAFRHRAYGVALDSAGSVPFELRYRWIGREFDEETGLYYLRARYYDPNSQRFTQEDPIGFGGGSNVYAYGNGNPTNGRDLNGLAKDFEYGAMASVDPSNPFADCMGTWDGCGGGGHAVDWMGDLIAEREIADAEREAELIRQLCYDGCKVVATYAHLSSINVREGDKVYAGDIIAYVGSTGLSTSPHLHLEIRVNGVAVDPLKFIKANGLVSPVDAGANSAFGPGSFFSRSRPHPILRTLVGCWTCRWVPRRRPHWGQDWGAPLGYPVQAIANGRVTEVVYGTSGFGNYVVIEH